MNKFGWADDMAIVKDYVVKIETPEGCGSGFLINSRTSSNRKREFVIATAFHVIEHALAWHEPIRIANMAANRCYAPDAYDFTVMQEQDLALVAIEACDDFKFPTRHLNTLDVRDDLPPGLPVAWCGFPNIVDRNICFFSGHLSSPVDESGDYFVDGSVLHGVSGAPAFIHFNNTVILIGVMAAHLSDRADGEVMPGLSLMRSVRPFSKHFLDTNKKRAERVRKEKARKELKRGKGK